MTNKSKLKIIVILVLVAAFLIGSVIAVQAATVQKSACYSYTHNGLKIGKVCMYGTFQGIGISTKGVSRWYAVRSYRQRGWTVTNLTYPYFSPTGWTTSYVNESATFEFKYYGVRQKFVACAISMRSFGNGVPVGGGGCY